MHHIQVSILNSQFSLSQPSLDYISQPSVLLFLSIIFPQLEPSRSFSLLSALASLLLSLSLLTPSTRTLSIITLRSPSLSQPRFSLSQPSLDYMSQPSVLPFLSIIFPLPEPSRSLSLSSLLISLASPLLSVASSQSVHIFAVCTRQLPKCFC